MKYNLSEIMTRAWIIKRNAYRLTFSECLKRAWASAKASVQREKEAAEMDAKYPSATFTNGMKISVDGNIRTLTRWTKAGHDRIYINGENRKSEGYVDLNTRKAVMNGNYEIQFRFAEKVLAMANI